MKRIHLTSLATALLLATPAAWGMDRFLDNGDGTVTDHQSGLTWMRDANCLGHQSWLLAKAAVAGINEDKKNCASYHGTDKDWRLPSQKELLTLIDPKAPHENVAVVAEAPFENEQQGHYWTADEKDASIAWYINLHNGHQDFTGKSSPGYVWPVRGKGN